MHIITRKRLNEFAEQHPPTRAGLAHWYQVLKKRSFESFVELRRAFPQADQVAGLTVFNMAATKPV